MIPSFCFRNFAVFYCPLWTAVDARRTLYASIFMPLRRFFLPKNSFSRTNIYTQSAQNTVAFCIKKISFYSLFPKKRVNNIGFQKR